MNTATTQITRDYYGQILSAPQAALNAAKGLIRQAINSNKIPPARDEMTWGNRGKERGKRIGTATTHEIYDAAPNGHPPWSASVRWKEPGTGFPLRQKTTT